MEDPQSHRPQHRGRELCYAIKVMACGGMIGTAMLFPLAAMLFPLADAEGLWLRAVTLSVFILSGLGFHALHLQPFLRFGPIVVPTGLALLLVAVLRAESSGKDLVPWLPLFIASLSLITVAVHEVAAHVQPRPLSHTAEDIPSSVSMGTLSERSFRTISTQQGPQRPLESYRFDPEYYSRHGPPSRASRRTGTEVSDISLSSITGVCRPQWDAQTRSLFPEALFISPEPDEELQARRTSPAVESSPDHTLDTDLDSDLETVESSHPLLGPQGGPIAQPPA